jgi:ATP-dependent Lon protease
VATGLAWTPVGGDVLFVEASAVEGKGKLTITVQLGDVMRESVQAALTWVRGHVDLDPEWFAEHDLHVHVPAGAIPKDGPSAGVTIVTALMSALTGRRVRSDVAMTGEVTLTGEVLPIGGLKEKALAAQRLGIKHVVAPSPNERDIEEIPEHLRKQIEFHFVEHVEEVLGVALQGSRVASRKRTSSEAREERNGKEDQGGQGNGRHRSRRRDPVRAATDPGRGAS